MSPVLEATLLDEVEDFIAGLSPMQRLALIQRRFEHREYPEIGRDLGCAETEARAAVYAALRKLRDRFGDQRQGVYARP